MITDDPQLKAVYSRAMGQRCFGYLAGSQEEAARLCKINPPHIVFIDQALPEGIAEKIVEWFKRNHPSAILVFLHQKSSMDVLKRLWGKVSELIEKPATESVIQWIYEKYCLYPKTGTTVWHLANQHINQMYSDPTLSEKRIAESLGMNSAYFSRLYSSANGQTFKDAITMTRIGEAKKLLLESDAQIKEIAQKVGYNHVASFIRAFKQLTGETPSDYRKRIQNTQVLES